MKTKLSPPWVTFAKEVAILFEKDNEVTCSYNDEKKLITIDVTNYEKARALKKILPKKKEFGMIVVDIEIEYVEDKMTTVKYYEAAFKNNPAFKYTFTFDTATNPISYVIFAKEVVQYWNDDMSDPHGVTSTLYENIASDVFDTEGIIFSTDSDENIQKKHYEKHATPEEIKLWEKYNGKGSYGTGTIKDCLDKDYLSKFNKK